MKPSRWVGRVLRDKWRIDARIARGGVGTVFAATHKNNGSRVAVKVLHTDLSRDADTRNRFVQEGYAANKVNHPGVVRVLDDDVTKEGLAFLVMELLEGELLEKRRVRKGGRLAVAEVFEIADQLLDVMAAAHDKGIVHRDIKPDNLFVTHEGRLKVLDFGFARLKTGSRIEQTATGFLLGTPGFMSPEQAVGNRSEIDAQTDIWAVGATLFTLISGAPVHEADSAAEMLVAAANFPARSLATVAPGLPPRLVEIVDRALAFEKAKRWPNARAMQAALRAVPGRQVVAGDVHAGRRSIPDLGEATQDGDRTLMDVTEDVELEELADADLHDENGSWQTDPVGRRPAPSRHPADEEGPTLAARSPFDARPVDPPSRDNTAIMDSGPALPDPAPAPVYERLQVVATPQAFAADPRRMSQPDLRQSFVDPGEMMFVAGPARPPPKRSGAPRVLAFITVMAISMIIVVVTGLLVLGAAD